MYTENDIRKEMDRLDTISGIQTDAIPVRISARMTSAWGKCVMDRTAAGYSVRELVFAERLLKYGKWEHLMEVIRHEYAHAFVLIQFHHRGNHDAIWRKWAQEFGCSGARCSSFLEVDDRLYRYFLTCNQCGSTAKYKRKSKIIQAFERNPNCKMYRCSKCGGRHFVLKSRPDVT